MAITRVKPTNWSFNEKLTSAQQNQLDTNTTYALDKRSGQTDSLQSDITIESGGSITLISTGDFTVSNSATLNNNGIISVNSGGQITVKSGGFLVAQSGSTLSLDSGSNLNISGAISTSSTSVATWAGDINHAFGSVVAFESGSNLSFQSGSAMAAGAGVSVNLQGATVTANSLEMTGTSRITYSGLGRTTTRILPNFWIPTSAGWINSNTLIQTTTALFEYAVLPIELPDGCSLSEIKVYIDPANHGTLPSNVPVITLYRVNLASGLQQNLASAVDPSLNAVGYSAHHEIFMTLGSPITIDKGFSYLLLFRSEEGSNALSGCTLYPAQATFTVPSMDPFAS